MNLPDILLWGFVATLILTGIMAAGVGLRLSRMSIPMMLGTMVTRDREKAPLLGFAAHAVVGWLFALLYALGFESWGRAEWWAGGLAGLVHGFVVLLVFMEMLPAIHPRMATERRGPEPTPMLEPPGFLALNYGRNTPIIALIAHLAYGIILGAFYHPG